MPDHTFASGEALTAANMNSFAAHTGSTFNTWTPAITQTGSVTATVVSATYHRAGRLITFQAIMAITGSGTASSVVICTLPITAASYATSGPVIGWGVIQDVSASADYPGPLYASSTTACQIGPSTVGVSTGARYGTTSFTAALANGDFIKYWGSYEAASG